MSTTALRPGELLLADLQPGAFVMIGPNPTNEKKGVLPSDRIFEVKAVNRNAAILSDTKATDSGASNTTFLAWKGQVRFYDADDLYAQLMNEFSKKPPPPSRERERELLDAFSILRSGLRPPRRKPYA